MDGLFVLQKKLLRFFQTKNYTIQKILEDINFNLHLSYLSNILGVINNCYCYLQRRGSNIVDFAIILTTSGVGKVRPASHMRLFDSLDLALQLFVRNTEDLFLLCDCTYIPHFQLLCGRKLFFCSLTDRWQLFDCSTYPRVAVSMKTLPPSGCDNLLVVFFHRVCC